MPRGIYLHKSPSKETRQKLSEAWKRNGHRLPPLWGRIVSPESRKKASESMKKRVAEGKHNMWKGGLVEASKKIRKSLEYKLWREAVFKRDNFTCIWCGAKSVEGNRVELNADHIKAFSQFPELRFSIDNGRTLCRPCHITTDTHGSYSHKRKT